MRIRIDAAREMARWLVLVVVAVSVLGVAGPALAQMSETQVATPPESPTVVDVSFGLEDIPRIDEREQLFQIDARVFATWTDERLAFDPDEAGADRFVYQGEGAAEKLKTDIWSPGFELVDGRGARERVDLAVTVWSDGDVWYEERFLATIFQPYDLDDFPFDSHTVSFLLEPFTLTTDDVVFGEVEALDFEIGSEEWTSDDVVTADVFNEGFASAFFSVSIARDPTFYLTNIILPLLLIVAISWAVFWMDFEDMTLADRLGVSITSLLTVVAFDFVTADTLPILPYSTRLDSLYTVSYVFVTLTVFMSLAGHRWAHDDMARADRLDRIGRRVFPIGFVVVAGLFLALG